MRIYRSERNGVTLWRVSGAVTEADARVLLRTMRGAARRLRGCHVVDWSAVEHVDYRAFAVLEERIPADVEILFCGMNDYILDIFAFSSRRLRFAVYPDWRTAVRQFRSDRGKMISAVAHGNTGFR